VLKTPDSGVAFFYPEVGRNLFDRIRMPAIARIDRPPCYREEIWSDAHAAVLRLDDPVVVKQAEP
jgi:hypothetical protein